MYARSMSIMNRRNAIALFPAATGGVVLSVALGAALNHHLTVFMKATLLGICSIEEGDSSSMK